MSDESSQEEPPPQKLCLLRCDALPDLDIQTQWTAIDLIALMTALGIDEHLPPELVQVVYAFAIPLCSFIVNVEYLSACDDHLVSTKITVQTGDTIQRILTGVSDAEHDCYGNLCSITEIKGEASLDMSDVCLHRTQILKWAHIT